MSQFIETIRIEDGNIDLLHYHNKRFNDTRKLFYCADNEWDLAQFIRIPNIYQKGLVKCRIVYDFEIREVAFSFYERQSIKLLKMIEANVNYPFKSINRNQLEQLKEQALPADEVLIVKSGKISDTSYSNIIFKSEGMWYTPDSPLLAGVRREYLLDKKLIKECSIRPNDLIKFDTFMLINAMMLFDESFALPIENILP